MKIKMRIISLEEIEFIILLLSVTYIQSNHIIRYILFGIGVFILITLIAKYKFKVLLYKDDLIIVLLIAWSAISGIITNNIQYRYIWWILLVYCTVIGFILGQLIFESNSVSQMSESWLFHFFIINVLLNLWAMYYQQSYSFYLYQGDLVFRGLCYEKNGLSVMLVLALPVFIDKIKRNDCSILKRLMVLGLIAGCFWMIFLSDSTGGLIIGIIATLFCVFTNDELKLKFIKIFPIALGIFVFYIFFIKTILQSNFNELLNYILHKDLSLSGRTEIWSFSISMIKRSPIIGYGLSGMWNNISLFTKAAFDFNYNIKIGAHAHSGYLELALTGGFIAICLLFLLFKSHYKKLVEMRKKSISISYEIFFFVYVVFSNLVENQLMTASITWCLIILFIRRAENIKYAK